MITCVLIIIILLMIPNFYLGFWLGNRDVRSIIENYESRIDMEDQVTIHWKHWYPTSMGNKRVSGKSVKSVIWKAIRTDLRYKYR